MLRPLSRRVCSSLRMFSVCCVCETVLNRVPSTIVPKQHICGPTAPPHTQSDKCFSFRGVCSMCTMMWGGRTRPVWWRAEKSCRGSPQTECFYVLLLTLHQHLNIQTHTEPGLCSCFQHADYLEAWQTGGALCPSAFLPVGFALNPDSHPGNVV